MAHGFCLFNCRYYFFLCIFYLCSNVFKVREVLQCPDLTILPGSNPVVRGVAHIRSGTLPIMDMSMATGNAALPDLENTFVIITEYNRSVQGFLIGEVLNIVNTSWSNIQPPPNSIGKANYLTAITQIDIEGKTELVEIIDVEKVLAEIIDYDIEISEEILDHDVIEHLKGQTVLIVDDSATARKQIRDTLEQLDINIIEENDGLMALKRLKKWADEGKSVTDEILMMFTDAEMPEMDGYRLTAEVRDDQRMSDLFIALNTSLSGNFNEAMVKKVGCNRFISKFQPDLLVDVVQQRMREFLHI